MSWWRRWRAAAARRRADELFARAEEMAAAEPTSDRTRAVARSAVEAAERLPGLEDAPADLRRLGRAWWRYATTFTTFQHGAGPAWRCWQVSARLLAVAKADPAAHDEAVEEVAGWLGFFLPVLRMLGHDQDADQAYRICRIAAEQASGPGGRHATARLLIFDISASVDPFAEARLAGRWSDVEARAYEAIWVGQWIIETLRGHTADGPFQVTELARTMQLVSQLLLLADQRAKSAAMLDEAVAIMATVADHGPRYRAMWWGMQYERDQRFSAAADSAEPAEPVLPAALAEPADPIPPAAPAESVPPAAAPEPDRPAAALAAYLVALQDLLGPDTPPELPPVTLTEAALVVKRLRAEEVNRPYPAGAWRGLALAWQARLMLDEGQPEAHAVAEESVRRLTLFSDRPERIQAAMIFALTLLARACDRTGDAEAAASARQRADAIPRRRGTNG